jgi:hypothetical protein
MMITMIFIMGIEGKRATICGDLWGKGREYWGEEDGSYISSYIYT